MFKKLLSLSLVALLINLAGAAPAYAASKEEKEARFAEKVKASVLKLGTGEAARVKVKLRDKTRLEGYISAADGERFIVTDSKTGMATTIAIHRSKASKGTISRRAQRLASVLALPQHSFLLFFGIQPAPAVINK